jgi:Cd2+/Zn2+-exporting ATPase
VVCLAVLIVFVPYIFSAVGLFHVNYTFKDYLYRGLVFLVVSCPCALMLSVPLSFFVNIGRAAKKGIVVKGSVFLEAFKECKYILFDKTGTLTKGSFQIVDIKPQKEYTKEYVSDIAASLEAYSNHPIAKAFKDKTQKYNFENIIELPGRGIKGEKDGDIFYVGNRRLLTELKINYQDTEEADSLLKLYLIINRDIVGEIYLNDQIKDDAEETIKELRKLGFLPVILSGDSEFSVKKVADKLGIKQYYHSLLPEEKLEILKSYQNGANKVAAVGDGLNDTALLSYADVGIAMGKTAASLSIEVADVVVIGSKVEKLCDLYNLSKNATKLSFENIAIALTIKVLVMGFALFGLSSLWAAIFADVGAALLVVFNSIKQIVIKSDIV